MIEVVWSTSCFLLAPGGELRESIFGRRPWSIRRLVMRLIRRKMASFRHLILDRRQIPRQTVSQTVLAFFKG